MNITILLSSFLLKFFQPISYKFYCQIFGTIAKWKIFFLCFNLWSNFRQKKSINPYLWAKKCEILMNIINGTVFSVVFFWLHWIVQEYENKNWKSIFAWGKQSLGLSCTYSKKSKKLFKIYIFVNFIIYISFIYCGFFWHKKMKLEKIW